MSEPQTEQPNTWSTTLLMSTSAAVLGILGIGAIMLPEVLLSTIGAPSGGLSVLPVKLLGAAYVGGAMLNWMAREKLIGGIYSRPVAIGNFIHFFAASIVLAKQLTAVPTPVVLAGGLVPFATLAASFGYIAFARGGSCG